MARKPSDRRHAEEEVAPLNLVPIMAIMVILVPMLIYIFTFHTIKVQRVMAPRQGTGKKTTTQKQEKELNLTIVIKKNRGFQITWEEALMPDRQSTPFINMKQVDAEFCGEGGDDENSRLSGCWPRGDSCFCYDYPALYNELVKLKNRFSKPDKEEKRVNIAAGMDPATGVTWEVISRTIDAAACRLEQDSYADFKEYMAAKPVKGEKPTKVPGVSDPVELCKPLFPSVVFAVAE